MPCRFEQKLSELNSSLLRQENVLNHEAAEEMEGNLVADEDLGKQSIVNGAERKSWMRNRKWRSFYLRHMC
jgi:hypothetical protein